MRMLSLLTLLIAAVFLLTPSVNDGLWDWFWAAHVLTKITSCCLALAIGGILGRCAWDIRLQNIQQRTWRNVAFCCAIGTMMFSMVLVATLNPVRAWMRSFGFVTLVTGIIASICKRFSPNHDASPHNQSMNRSRFASRVRFAHLKLSRDSVIVVGSWAR